MSEEIARMGNFKLLNYSGLNNDYVLTDLNESVLLGFDEEEVADLKILLNKLNSDEW